MASGVNTAQALHSIGTIGALRAPLREEPAHAEQRGKASAEREMPTDVGLGRLGHGARHRP